MRHVETTITRGVIDIADDTQAIRPNRDRGVQTDRVGAGKGRRGRYRAGDVGTVRDFEIVIRNCSAPVG